MILFIYRSLLKNHRFENDCFVSDVFNETTISFSQKSENDSTLMNTIVYFNLKTENIFQLVYSKGVMQGKLIAVVYILRTYWNQFSLGGICKQERCISVRLVSEEEL